MPRFNCKGGTALWNQHCANNADWQADLNSQHCEQLRERDEEAQLAALEERLHHRAQERAHCAPPAQAPAKGKEEEFDHLGKVWSFPRTDKIIIIGLKQAPQYNFYAGEVIDLCNERYLVKLAGRDTILKIKSENMKRDPAYY